jgi:hypothetical protein
MISPIPSLQVASERICGVIGAAAAASAAAAETSGGEGPARPPPLTATNCDQPSEHWNQRRSLATCETRCQRVEPVARNDRYASLPSLSTHGAHGNSGVSGRGCRDSGGGAGGPGGGGGGGGGGGSGSCEGILEHLEEQWEREPEEGFIEFSFEPETQVHRPPPFP